MANGIVVVPRRDTGLKWVCNLVLEALCIKPLSIYISPTTARRHEQSRVALADMKELGVRLAETFAKQEDASLAPTQFTSKRVIAEGLKDQVEIGVLEAMSTPVEIAERNSDMNVLFCTTEGSLAIRMNPHSANVPKGSFYRVGKSLKRSLILQPHTRVYYIQFP